MSDIKNPVIPIPVQPDLLPYQVLRRTDGILVVIDTRRPGGYRTVWIGKPASTLEVAIGKATKMYEEMGSHG